jgi:hypothetical protein
VQSYEVSDSWLQKEEERKKERKERKKDRKERKKESAEVTSLIFSFIPFQR